MTIEKALDITDEMMPNMMSRRLKISFLTEIEQLIHQEIIMKHEHTPEQETLPVYTEDTDPETELLIPDPYSKLYYYYLISRIDEQNLEIDKFNTHWALFENNYDTMSDWYTRKYRPLTAMPYFGL